VTKSELLETVWANETVVPDVLTTALHGLRRALRDDPRRPHIVKTLHRVGYKLVATVTPAARAGDATARFLDDLVYAIAVALDCEPSAEAIRDRLGTRSLVVRVE
jgi:DNA-binding winged helix-turn-helix (wHTH) protein